MTHLFQFTLVAPRCAKIFDRDIGGLTLSETLLIMSLSVTFAVASRQNIKGLLELCNPLLFLNGNGTKSKWISLLVFPDRRRVMMLFLSSLTDSQRLLTFCQLRRQSLLVS